MKKIIFLLMALLVAAISPPLYAATPGLIDIRFGGSNANTYVGAGVIGNAGDVWNLIPAKPVVDDLGTPTPVQLVYADGTGSSAAIFSYLTDVVVNSSMGTTGFKSTAQAELMRNYVYTSLSDLPSSAYDTMTITGLDKNKDYNLYVLSQTEKTKGNNYGNGQYLQMTVTGTTTYNLLQTAASDGSLDHFVAGQNYLSGVVRPDASGTLQIKYMSAIPNADSPKDRGAVNAMQLSPTPEPASMVLIGVGGVLMSAMKLRKKKASDSSVA